MSLTRKNRHFCAWSGRPDAFQVNFLKEFYDVNGTLASSSARAGVLGTNVTLQSYEREQIFFTPAGVEEPLSSVLVEIRRHFLVSVTILT
jgi:hypothetical protein